jgi:hypothetical protein
MSSTAITVQENAGLLNQDDILQPVMNLQIAKQRLAEFQTFVKDYLKENEDYGTIPGTPKPTLYKPGADKLCELYGLGDSYDIIDKVEDFDRGLFDYTIRCTLVRLRSGVAVSTGLGSCNSYEGRYRFREGKRSCPQCGKESIIKGKEEFGGGWLCYAKKGGCGAKFGEGDAKIVGQIVGKIENDDIATLKNTILKMAKKRAKVDATLAATRSSGIFNQDVEDMGDDGPSEPAKQAPARRGAQARKPESEKVICASCGKANGHDPSCKYAAPQQSAEPPKPAAQAAPAGPQALVFLPSAVERKESKTGATYFVIKGVDQSNAERMLYCFHASLGAELEKGLKKTCLLKVSQVPKGDKMFTQVDEVLEIGGVKYKDGKPVVEGVVVQEDPGW